MTRRRAWRRGLLPWGAGMAVAVLAGAVPASAQSYRFRVPVARMQVWVEPDASVLTEYQLTFANDAGAHEIDVVDLGTYHAEYDLATMQAWIDDEPLTDIRPSQYVDPGSRSTSGPGPSPAVSAGASAFATACRRWSSRTPPARTSPRCR